VKVTKEVDIEVGLQTPAKAVVKDDIEVGVRIVGGEEIGA
jgi:hypothetical protein